MYTVEDWIGGRTEMYTVEDWIDRVRTLSATLGLTQRQLARAAGVSQPQLNRWLKGHTEPTLGSALRVLVALISLHERTHHERGQDLGRVSAIGTLYEAR